MQIAKHTTNRTRYLMYIVVALAVVFVVRLFYLQVMQHDYYKTLANSEQMRQWKLPAVRGELYIMNQDKPVKLVLNETVYTVWADPQVVEQPEKVLEVLNRVAGGNLRNNAGELLKKENTRYQILARKISYTQAQLIKKEKLYGIGFERAEQRVYPEGQLASQVVGFVNSEGYGQYGVEESLNDELTGSDGLIKTVADVRDVPLTIGNDNINIPAKNGKDVVLSIDRGTQARAEKALADGLKRSGANSASMIVMDPRDGSVQAMANLPTYNPGNLASIKDIGLFNNSIISSPYEPGSVIKAFTVATGIDTGTISPSSTFVNTDQIRVADRTIGNASKGHTGTKTMQYALDWSLNTGMVTIGHRLGGGDLTRKARDTIYEYFNNRFRLGKTTGIELAGETTGSITSPDEVQGNAVRYATMTFGQGMSATMLQVSAAFSAAINGGVYHQPTVVAGEMTEGGGFKASDRDRQTYPVISKETSLTTREMIHKAHNATYKPQNERQGYYIGGKTGTSQTIDAAGNYTNDETVATYLGFGGEKGETPSYVIMVRISGDNMVLGGGTDAKPIFNDMSNWLLDYLKLQPKG